MLSRKICTENAYINNKHNIILYLKQEDELTLISLQPCNIIKYFNTVFTFVSIYIRYFEKMSF